MPTPQDALGLYHITLVGELHGETTQNGFWFMDAQGTAAQSYTESLFWLVTDFRNFIYPIITVWANQQWHTRAIIGTTQVPHAGPMVEDGPLAGGGAQVDDSLPSFCAGLLAIRTGAGGRRYRGRLYFAGVSENLCESSRLVDGSLTLLQNIGDELITRYGAGGTSLRHRYGVYSPTEGNIRHPGPPPWIEHQTSAFRPATSIIASEIVYTQRKRLLHKGI